MKIAHMTSSTFLMLVGPVVKLYVPLDGLIHLYHSDISETLQSYSVSIMTQDSQLLQI